MRVLIITGILFSSATLYAADNERLSPRLKFKNGPVCMCTDGLSEKDILAGKAIKKDVDKNGSIEKTQQLETSHNRDTEDK